MEHYADLKELVKKLENETNERAQIKLLQTIGEKLLTEYVIQIDDDVIEPLRVEAYYYPYKNAKKFDDHCAHLSPKKLGNFGKLYFIEPQYGYEGIDLCLSLGDYYLSFLIKNSRIGDTYYRQTELPKRFQSRAQEIESREVLVKVENSHKPVFHTVRVGLSSKNTKFPRSLLACVIDIDLTKKIKRFFTWEKGYAKEWMVANYLAENGLPATDENVKRYLGSRSQKVCALVEEFSREREQA